MLKSVQLSWNLTELGNISACFCEFDVQSKCGKELCFFSSDLNQTLVWFIASLIRNTCILNLDWNLACLHLTRWATKSLDLSLFLEGNGGQVQSISSPYFSEDSPIYIHPCAVLENLPNLNFDLKLSLLQTHATNRIFKFHIHQKTYLNIKQIATTTYL